MVETRTDHVRRVAAVCIFALSLAGCLDIKGRVGIKEDGSGEAILKFGLVNSIYYQLPPKDKQSFCDGLNVPEIFGRPERVASEKYVYCKFSRAFPHVKYLKMDSVVAGEENDGTWSLILDLPQMISKTMMKKGSEGRDQMPRSLDEPLQKSIQVTFSVSAPHIISTNGLVSEDHKTARYITNLADLLHNPEGIFTVRFYCRKGWFGGKKC